MVTLDMPLLHSPKNDIKLQVQKLCRCTYILGSRLGNPKTLQMVHCLCKQWFLLAPTVGRTTHYPTNAKVCGGVGGYFGGNMITS